MTRPSASRRWRCESFVVKSHWCDRFPDGTWKGRVYAACGAVLPEHHMEAKGNVRCGVCVNLARRDKEAGK